MSQAMTDIEARTKEDDTDCQIESHDESISNEDNKEDGTYCHIESHDEIISDEEIFKLKWGLLKATSSNDWETAQAIYEKHPSMVSVKVNHRGQTALELAVLADHTEFVQEFVNHMTPQDLEIKNADGETAFYTAVEIGDYDFVKIMCEKNEKLPLIPDDKGMLPIQLAVLKGYSEIVEYIISSCGEKLLQKMEDKAIEKLFFLTIRKNMYDAARDLLSYDEKLSYARDDEGLTALHMLARKSRQEFGERESSWLLDNLWYEVKKWECNKIVELITTPSVVLFDAIKSGNTEVLEILLESKTENEFEIVVQSRTEILPEIKRELMKIKDSKNGRGLLHYAVLYRRPNIVSFLLQMETVDDMKQDEDNFGNNVLHFAMLGPKETSSISSPKFQMLEALWWFKKLENKFPPELKKKKNKDGKTPIEIFDAIMHQYEVLSKDIKKEKNREAIKISGDGTSNLHNEQIPVEVTPAAASTQNQQIPAEATPAAASTQNENIKVYKRTSDDPDHFKRILHSAASDGQWDKANSIFNRFPQMIGVPLDAIGNTTLHVAVSTNNCAFVKNLVDHMNKDDLEIENAEGKTAFHTAVLAGKADFLKIMIQKNKDLPLIRGPDEMLPVHLAASSNRREIVQDLCSWNLLGRMEYDDIQQLFFLTIRRNMYDVAIELLDKYPSKMAIARDNGKYDGLTALHMLAQKHSEEFVIESHDVESNNKLWWLDMLHLVGKLWELVRELEYNKIVELMSKPSVVLLDAVKSGNVPIVQHLLAEKDRQLLMIKDPTDGMSLLHYVVLYRQRDIFHLILKMKNVVNDMILDADKYGNNILHFAALDQPGKSSKLTSDIQMKTTLKWFKEVENNTPPELKKKRNMHRETPEDILHTKYENFSEKVKDSAKTIANSGMVVGTLTAAVAFAAALTGPGNKKDAEFIVFILSNAIALFCSFASIVSFMATFSSRFTKKEAIILLHPCVILGNWLLYISITALVIAFVAASFLIFDERNKWVAYVVTTLGVLPIILMVLVLQIPPFDRLLDHFFKSRYYAVSTEVQ